MSDEMGALTPREEKPVLGLPVEVYVAQAIAKADGQIDWDSLPELMKHEFTRYAAAAIKAYAPIHDAILRAAEKARASTERGEATPLPQRNRRMSERPDIFKPTCFGCKSLCDPVEHGMYGGLCERCAREEWEALRRFLNGASDELPPRIGTLDRLN
jgi:hypothetical protein